MFKIASTQFTSSYEGRICSLYCRLFRFSQQFNHPPYSPDAAPSDYGLIRSMKHFLNGKMFNDINEVEAACLEFFYSKSCDWYVNQIRILSDCWKKIIENEGLYFSE